MRSQKVGGIDKNTHLWFYYDKEGFTKLEHMCYYKSMIKLLIDFS